MSVLKSRIQKLEAAQPSGTDSFVPVFFIGCYRDDELKPPIIGYSFSNNEVSILPNESVGQLQQRAIDKFKALHPDAHGGLFFEVLQGDRDD